MGTDTLKISSSKQPKKNEKSVLINKKYRNRKYFKMCQATSTQNSNNENHRGDNQNWQEYAQAQERLYPNLEQMLNNLLPENQTEFLRNFFAGNRETNGPTAPPPPPPPNANPTAPPP